MTPEKQRIAIAEACGWKHVTWNGGDSIPFGDNPKGNRSTRAYDHLPDYLSDLNAMNKAAAVVLDASQKAYYCDFLHEVTESDWEFDTIEATAAQRAEAFLKAKGLWEQDAV